MTAIIENLGKKAHTHTHAHACVHKGCTPANNRLGTAQTPWRAGRKPDAQVKMFEVLMIHQKESGHLAVLLAALCTGDFPKENDIDHLKGKVLSRTP